MDCIGRKKISIAGAQSVGLVADAKLEFTAQNPVRLIFGVGVRTVPGPGRVAPLKDAVAFAFEALLQLGRVWRSVFMPSFDLNTHVRFVPGGSVPFASANGVKSLRPGYGFNPSADAEGTDIASLRLSTTPVGICALV